MSTDPSWLGSHAAPGWPVPAWLATVAPPRTREGDRISEDARGRLLVALERGGDALAPFLAWLDPSSLRAHAWALVEAWADHGCDPRDRWIFGGLRVVSDDELEERLLPEDATADGARRVVEEQRARLERALSTGRDWSVADWRHQLVEHPLLRHLVRGLVWASGETAFVVEDDGTLADVDQDEVRLAAQARVRLVHPVELDEVALAGWGERLADAELVQPFAQLARPVSRIADRGGDAIASGVGALPETTLTRALGVRAWERGEPDERMRVRYFHKPFVGAGIHAVLVIAPGIGREPAVQRPGEAFFLRRPPGGVTFPTDPRVPLVEVAPIALSEVLFDLGALGSLDA